MLAPTPIKPSYQSAAIFTIVKVDSPVQPAVLDNGAYPLLQETHQETGA